MERAHCVTGRACSWLTSHAAALIAGLAVVWMASAPRPACGQSSWPNYPNNTAISVTPGGNAGIGTASPTEKLSVGGGNIGFDYGYGLKTNTGAYRNILTTGWDTYGDYVGFYTAGTGAGNANPVMYLRTGGNVGIGTTNPQYKLAVNGAIGAKEVIVTNTGWPDCVFKPGYRLQPLSEVGAYIRAHHHLPGIPSEAEVKEKGVSVGEMQARLLEKIEELTLRMIEQDKVNRELRERVAQLETRAAGTGAAAAGR